MYYVNNGDQTSNQLGTLGGTSFEKGPNFLNYIQ